MFIDIKCLFFFQLEYEPGEEKHEGDVPTKDEDLEDVCESENEKSDMSCDESTLAEPAEDNVPDVKSETAEQPEAAQEEPVLGTSSEGNALEDVKAEGMEEEELDEEQNVEKKEEEDDVEEENKEKTEVMSEEEVTKEKGRVVLFFFVALVSGI